MRMEIQITTPQNTKEPTIFGLFILTIIAIFRGVTYLFSPQRQFIGQIWRIYINREKAYQKPNNITELQWQSTLSKRLSQLPKTYPGIGERITMKGKVRDVSVSGHVELILQADEGKRLTYARFTLPTEYAVRLKKSDLLER